MSVKMYYKIALYIIIMFIMVGFILPLLFSAESTIAVGLGVLLVIQLLPLTFYYYVWTFKK